MTTACTTKCVACGQLVSSTSCRRCETLSRSLWIGISARSTNLNYPKISYDAIFYLENPAAIAGYVSQMSRL